MSASPAVSVTSVPAATSSTVPSARTTSISASARTPYEPSTTYSTMGPAQQVGSQVERVPAGILKSANPDERRSPLGIASADRVVVNTVSTTGSSGEGVATTAAGIELGRLLPSRTMAR